MRVAIISDIHDHVWHLAGVLDHVRDCGAMVCCGDLCSPFVLAQLASGFEGEVHVVFGNNDGDRFMMSKVASTHDHVHLHGELFEGELGGTKFAANHYPEIAHRIAESGTCDVVCFGHSHELGIAHAGSSLLVNPGAVMGYDPVNSQDVPATFVVYDTEAGTAESFEVVPEREPAAGEDGSGTQPGL